MQAFIKRKELTLRKFIRLWRIDIAGAPCYNHEKGGRDMKIEVNSTQLYYERTGTGTPLLLLHGNGESHAIFDRAVPLLAPRFDVICVDTRGHGQSAPVSHFDYRDMAEDVAALIRALRLRSPCVYGFSDGGIAALLLAIRSPELPSRIAVSGVNVSPRGLVRSFLRQTRADARRSRDPLLKLMLTQPHIPARALKTIRIPVLLTAGENDLVTPRHTRRIAETIPDCSHLLLAGETHDSYVVHSEKIALILLRYFGGADL